jgi:hypothetical protein
VFQCCAAMYMRFELGGLDADATLIAAVCSMYTDMTWIESHSRARKKRSRSVEDRGRRLNEYDLRLRGGLCLLSIVALFRLRMGETTAGKSDGKARNACFYHSEEFAHCQTGLAPPTLAYVSS